MKDFKVVAKLKSQDEGADFNHCTVDMIHSMLKAAAYGHMDLESMTIVFEDEPVVDKELPKTIKRWCCEGKSCGNTELELVTHHFDYSDTDMHMYVRKNNGQPYADTGWLRTDRMWKWLEFTKNNINPEPEEG